MVQKFTKTLVMQDKINQTMFHEGQVDKAQIAQWLDRDLEGLLGLLYAIKQSQVVKNVVVEYLYESYVAGKLEKAAKDRKQQKKDMEASIQEGEGYAVQ